MSAWGSVRGSVAGMEATWAAMLDVIETTDALRWVNCQMITAV